jgi:hypothetical protein
MNKKPLTEKQSRARLLEHARKNGTEDQLLKIFRRFDHLILGAKTQEERDAIATAGVIEIHNFFGSSDELVINGMKIK